MFYLNTKKKWSFRLSSMTTFFRQIGKSSVTIKNMAEKKFQINKVFPKDRFIDKIPDASEEDKERTKVCSEKTGSWKVL